MPAKRVHELAKGDVIMWAASQTLVAEVVGNAGMFPELSYLDAEGKAIRAVWEENPNGAVMVVGHLEPRRWG